MMKLIIIYFCLLSLFGKASTGNTKFPVNEIPEELKEHANAVLRLDENIFTVLSPDKGKYKQHWAITVLNKSGEKYAVFAERYDKLVKISGIKGYLYDANGKLIKKLKTADIIDRSNISGFSLYEDNRVKIASLEHHSYPYTVEFECEIEYDGLYYYPSWYPQYSRKIAVQNSSMIVDVPKNLSLRYDERNVNPVNQSEQEDREIYSWSSKNIPAYEYELFTDRTAYEKMVFLAPTKFGIEGEFGDMTDWETYGKFYAQLNANTRDIAEGTKQKLKEITAHLKSDKEKIAFIYQYLQDKTRYVSIQVGIGGIKPFPASTVDEKGYGDCKALSNYTKALLEAVGIDSYYTLVGASSDFFPVKKDFPADYFNHVILCVPLEKDTIWLECTSQTEAFGYLGDFTGNRDVLAITPEGGKVLKTPSYGKEVNYTKRKAIVEIDDEGNAGINVNTKFGTLQEANRSFVCERTKEEQKKWLYENVGISNITITDFELKRHKSAFPFTEEKLNIEVPKFASISGKRIFLSPNVMAKWDDIPPTDEERTREVYLDYSYDFIDTDTIEYRLPENYHIEFRPEPVEITTQFGSYQMKIETENNIIRYYRRWEMNPGKYPAETYSELRGFLKDISKHDKVKVVLVNNT